MTSVGRTLRRVERHVCQFCHGVREDHDNVPERVTASSRAFANLLEKRAEKTKTWMALEAGPNSKNAVISP